MWFEGIAWAQANAGSAGPQGMLDQIISFPAVPMVLIIGVIYFLMIRPQTQKASAHQKMLKALKRNDEVVTTGGLVGRVAELDDKVVVLEIAQGVRVRVERQHISALSSYGKTVTRKEKG
jgi:preprotein translocase subunit YajC